jgi:magnesium chelatase family protein
MITKLYSAALRGVDALEVEVEVNARGSETPCVIIVGLPDAAVRESSQRVTSAIVASALELDLGIKTVNLAPADLKKEGPSFDLPIALAMVGASGTKILETDGFCVVGELGLDGMVRPVKGVLSIALEARKRGRKFLIVPEANAAEAAVIEGIEIIPVKNLRQAWDFISGEKRIAPFVLDRRAFFESHRNYLVDFNEVKGQQHVKRALEVAAAGGHNLLILLHILPGWVSFPCHETTRLFLHPILFSRPSLGRFSQTADRGSSPIRRIQGIGTRRELDHARPGSQRIRRASCHRGRTRELPRSL